MVAWHGLEVDQGILPRRRLALLFSSAGSQAKPYDWCRSDASDAQPMERRERRGSSMEQPVRNEQLGGI